jgi:predicted DNA-binding WGR domain protein
MSDREALVALLEANTAPASFGYALFEKVSRERNEDRYYYLAWQPTLVDEGAVVRLWGRKGETQQTRATPFGSLAEAWPLLRRLMRLRLRHGYRLVEVGGGE